MLRSLVAVSLVLAVCGCASKLNGVTEKRVSPSTDAAPIRVVLASEIDWQALNPARGDMSPRAGTLWGDRNAATPTGFLAEFKDGFSSPPHIHNVSYRAVVISGGIHNDDPDAEQMWMGPGSFWTQPKGEAHITSARGDKNVALVEIDYGPYLVKPTTEAFDSGERPINVDISNVVWLPFAHESDGVTGAFVAYLWGQHEAGTLRGVFLKLSPGFVGAIRAGGSEFHGVVIQGILNHSASDGHELTAGSYFGSEGASVHHLSSGANESVVIYIRTNDQLRLDANR